MKTDQFKKKNSNQKSKQQLQKENIQLLQQQNQSKIITRLISEIINANTSNTRQVVFKCEFDQNKIFLNYNVKHFDNILKDKTAIAIDQTKQNRPVILQQLQYEALQVKIKRCFKRQGIHSQNPDFVRQQKIIEDLLNGIIIKFRQVLNKKTHRDNPQDNLLSFDQFIYCYKKSDLKLSPIYIPGMRWICIKLIRQIIRICSNCQRFKQCIVQKLKANNAQKNLFGTNADTIKKNVENNLKKIRQSIINSQKNLYPHKANATNNVSNQASSLVNLNVAYTLKQKQQNSMVQVLIREENKCRFFKKVYDYCKRNLCNIVGNGIDEDSVESYNTFEAYRLHSIQNKKYEGYHNQNQEKTQIVRQKIEKVFDGKFLEYIKDYRIQHYQINPNKSSMKSDIIKLSQIIENINKKKQTDWYLKLLNSTDLVNMLMNVNNQQKDKYKKQQLKALDYKYYFQQLKDFKKYCLKYRINYTNDKKQKKQSQFQLFIDYNEKIILNFYHGSSIENLQQFKTQFFPKLKLAGYYTLNHHY